MHVGDHGLGLLGFWGKSDVNNLENLVPLSPQALLPGREEAQCTGGLLRLEGPGRFVYAPELNTLRLKVPVI